MADTKATPFGHVSDDDLKELLVPNLRDEIRNMPGAPSSAELKVMRKDELIRKLLELRAIKRAANQPAERIAKDIIDESDARNGNHGNGNGEQSQVERMRNEREAEITEAIAEAERRGREAERQEREAESQRQAELAAAENHGRESEREEQHRRAILKQHRDQVIDASSRFGITLSGVVKTILLAMLVGGVAVVGYFGYEALGDQSDDLQELGNQIAAVADREAPDNSAAIAELQRKLDAVAEREPVIVQTPAPVVESVVPTMDLSIKVQVVGVSDSDEPVFARFTSEQMLQSTLERLQNGSATVDTIVETSDPDATNGYWIRLYSGFQMPDQGGVPDGISLRIECDGVMSVCDIDSGMVKFVEEAGIIVSYTYGELTVYAPHPDSIVVDLDTAEGDVDPNGDHTAEEAMIRALDTGMVDSLDGVSVRPGRLEGDMSVSFRDGVKTVRKAKSYDATDNTEAFAIYQYGKLVGYVAVLCGNDAVQGEGAPVKFVPAVGQAPTSGSSTTTEETSTTNIWITGGEDRETTTQTTRVIVVTPPTDSEGTPSVNAGDSEPGEGTPSVNAGDSEPGEGTPSVSAGDSQPKTYTGNASLDISTSRPDGTGNPCAGQVHTELVGDRLVVNAVTAPEHGYSIADISASTQAAADAKALAIAETVSTELEQAYLRQVEYDCATTVSDNSQVLGTSAGKAPVPASDRFLAELPAEGTAMVEATEAHPTRSVAAHSDPDDDGRTEVIMAEDNPNAVEVFAMDVDPTDDEHPIHAPGKGVVAPDQPGAPDENDRFSDDDSEAGRVDAPGGRGAYPED